LATKTYDWRGSRCSCPWLFILQRASQQVSLDHHLGGTYPQNRLPKRGAKAITVNAVSMVITIKMDAKISH